MEPEIKTKRGRPSVRLHDNRTAVLAVLANYGVHNARVFGSVARGEDQEESDLDLLVDLPRGIGLFKRGRLTQDLEDVLGCRVDLVQDCEVPERSRDHVLHEARPL
ncbi:MAG: nucleotidyltransferase family protein [Ferrimicrobium sp.]